MARWGSTSGPTGRGRWRSRSSPSSWRSSRTASRAISTKGKRRSMPSERADRTGPVARILLAAGTSSRMGSNKMLFDLGGESVLRGAAKRAVDAGLSPLVVVLGHQRERAEQELAGLPCEVAFNPDYEEGITSSLRTGLA